MKFTIKAVLSDRVAKDKTQRVIIQVIYNRILERAPTPFAVLKNQIKNNEFISHPHAAKMNSILRQQLHAIENRLLDALRDGPVNKEELKNIVKGDAAKKKL